MSAGEGPGGLEKMGTAHVRARALWFRTGIRLEAGARYRICARGIWRDWFVACGPAGYRSLLLSPLAPGGGIPMRRGAP